MELIRGMRWNVEKLNLWYTNCSRAFDKVKYHKMIKVLGYKKKMYRIDLKCPSVYWRQIEYIKMKNKLDNNEQVEQRVMQEYFCNRISCRAKAK